MELARMLQSPKRLKAARLLITGKTNALSRTPDVPGLKDMELSDLAPKPQKLFSSPKLQAANSMESALEPTTRESHVLMKKASANEE